jgi:hypothetical protein
MVSPIRGWAQHGHCWYLTNQRLDRRATVASAADSSQQRHQYHRPDNRDNKGAEEPERGINEEAADDAPDNAQNDVAKETMPPAHQASGDQTGETAHDNPPQDAIQQRQHLVHPL